MIRLHNMNRTHTFIDVESGQFISLPKDETDKPPVNADINGLQFFGKTTQDGEPTPDNPVDLVNIPPEFNLTVCGKNILPDKEEHWEQGTLASADGKPASAPNRIRLKSEYMIKVSPNTLITSSFISGYVLLAVHEYNINKEWIGRQAELSTVTVSANTHFVRLVVARADSGDLVPSDIEIINAQLELGNMSTAYQAYQGKSYPYRLEDVNGVLHYGGDLPDGTADSVNWETGQFVENVKKDVVLDGSENWYLIATNPNTMRFYTVPADRKTGTAVRCDKFEYFNSLGGATVPIDTENITSGATIAITVLKSRLATEDVAGFKLWLAGNPVTVQYALAEPVTYQIKQYGETYGGVVWEYNEKPKSIQYYTNIFTDNDIDMQCEVRKLGNRKMGEFYWVTENGDYIVTDDNDYIMLEY